MLLNYIIDLVNVYVADYDSSEQENERQEVLIKANIEDKEKNIVVIQQTGFLTRRIVCNLNNEDKVQAGKRFGIIKFGSRVTIYIPKEATLFVTKNQTVIGGETIIASFKENLSAIKDHTLE